MRAISVWQPWATAIILGSKLIETRDWGTTHRGPLLIHAAKHAIPRQCRLDIEMWRKVLGVRELDDLSFGCLLGIVDVIDSLPVERFTQEELFADRGGYREFQLGNFSSGRFGWRLKSKCQFVKPIPYVGRQRFFIVPTETLDGIHWKNT